MLLDDFLFDCKLKGLSPRTIELYRQHLVRYVNHPEPDRFMAYLMDQGLSRFTVASYGRSINSYLSWGKQEGELNTPKVKLPKLPRLIKNTLDRADINIMESLAGSERDKVIIRVLADTGVRITELTKMRAGDIVERSGRYYIKVHGKGEKDREVPLAPRLTRRMRRLSNEGPLFKSMRSPYLPLQRRGVQKIVTELGNKLGRKVNPHLFRHSFITHQLRQGLNPFLLAKVVGHEDLSMIMRVYSHVQAEDAYEPMVKNLAQS